MNLINAIEEQSTFGFTGKINTLLSSNDQFLGAIYLLNGKLVHAIYQGSARKKALFNMIFDELQRPNNYKYIVEPEFVPGEISTFNYSYESFSKLVNEYIENYLEYKKLIPPNNLKLMVDSNFIIEGEEVTVEEFGVLATITEYAIVSDIYYHSKFHMFHTSKALISLRKKGAIKVCKKNV